MEVQDLYLTKEGLEKLHQELKDLKAQRVEITHKIKEAREFGDLSENAEYQEAKTKQSFVEGRIEEIESLFKLATVVEDHHSGSIVEVGCTVTVDVAGSEREYHITGSNEASPLEGRISNESPLGRALVGRKIGETVTLATPDGERTYKILKVR